MELRGSSFDSTQRSSLKEDAAAVIKDYRRRSISPNGSATTEHQSPPSGGKNSYDSDATTDTDQLSPLPSSLRVYSKMPASSHTHQDEIRMMTMLNGKIESNWKISDRSSSQRKIHSKRKKSSSAAKSPFGAVSYASISSPKNRFARRFSESPMGAQLAVRRQLVKTQPRAAGFHRVQEMFAEENNLDVGEMIGERIVTSFIKHESLGSNNSADTANSSGTSDTYVAERMEVDAFDQGIFQLPGSNFSIQRPFSSVSDKDSPGSVSENSPSDVLSSAVTNLKRKLSADLTAEGRESPSFSLKRGIYRPATPTPHGSPSASWRYSNHTPEKLKRLKRSVATTERRDRSYSDTEYSPSSVTGQPVTISNSTTLAAPAPTYRNRGLSSGQTSRASGTPRFLSISSDLGELADLVDDGGSVVAEANDSERGEDTASVSSHQHEWRQTDIEDDDEDHWGYGSADYP